jgi:LacI family transcriptional regulator
VAGLILAPTPADHAWLRPAGQSTPVVLVDRAASGLDADLVAIDDHAAAAQAVRHLIAHGHRRIAYIGDYPDVATSRSRLAGFRDTMATAGLAVPPELVRATCPDQQTAARATADLLAMNRPTAIFSAATRCSLGVIPALHARGRHDVAVVGFGDFAMADTLQPGITVLDHPAAAVGRAAMERLAARLARPDLPIATRHMPVLLVERGSGEMPA